MCEVLKVNRNSYYAWKLREPSARQQEHEKLVPIVQQADRDSDGTYDSRGIAKEIKKTGTSCGRTKAASVMALADVKAKQKKKFKVTTDSKYQNREQFFILIGAASIAARNLNCS
jgi:hypothetical protein